MAPPTTMVTHPAVVIGDIQMPDTIRIAEINFAKIRRNLSSPDKAFMNALRYHGLLKEHYGYSAFAPGRFEDVIRTGQYRFTDQQEPESTIFCCRWSTAFEENKSIADHVSGRSILNYCESVTPLHETTGMIAVYDLNKVTSLCTVEFTFIPEALVGIVKLKEF